MAVTPKRATGANVKLRLRYETAYGEQAAGNYVAVAAYTYGLSKEQPLESDPLLGQGRDPLAPTRGAIDVTGSAAVPVDQRLIGYWLKGLLGAPIASTQVGARGFISFNVNPANNQTIVLNGTTWTFVTGAPVGNQTQIGASLSATLAALVISLNGSANSGITPATYSTFGDRLVIDHDTASAAGNTYTLASAIPGIRLSGATLAGGGLFRHEFRSGAAALPSLTIETEHGDLEGGSNRFFVHPGVLVNTLSIERQRSGAARATLALIAQNETAAAASVAGAPAVVPINLFSQFQGEILVDGVAAANVTAGNLAIGNSLDVVPALRSDGLIEGADTGQTAVTLSLTARFSNTALRTAAEAQVPVEIRYGFRDAPSGAELLCHLHEFHLPQPRREIAGPGGVEVTYDGQGAQQVSLGRGVTVTLWNDRANYDNPV